MISVHSFQKRPTNSHLPRSKSQTLNHGCLLNQESANLRGGAKSCPPRFCKRHITGTLPQPHVLSMVASSSGLRAAGRDCTAGNRCSWPFAHTVCPPKGSNNFFQPHSLHSSHNGLPAVLGHRKQVPTSHPPPKGFPPPRACKAAQLLKVLSCPFSETFPNHTVFNITSLAQQRKHIPAPFILLFILLQSADHLTENSVISIH